MSDTRKETNSETMENPMDVMFRESMEAYARMLESAGKLYGKEKENDTTC